MKQMFYKKKKFDWKAEIAKRLRQNYGDDATIRFDGEVPTLVFKDDSSAEFRKRVIIFTTELYRRMGGEVMFYGEPVN
jgi:hypothetical protein